MSRPVKCHVLGKDLQNVIRFLKLVLIYSSISPSIFDPSSKLCNFKSGERGKYHCDVSALPVTKKEWPRVRKSCISPRMKNGHSYRCAFINANTKTGLHTKTNSISVNLFQCEVMPLPDWSRGRRNRFYSIRVC